MLPRITVVLFTYTPSLDHPRRAYAWDTWRALAGNLRYEGPLRWHIADDGSPPEHVVALRDGEALGRNRRAERGQLRDAVVVGGLAS